VYAGTDYDYGASLYLGDGKLVNAASVLSIGAGRPAAINYLYLNGGYNSSGAVPFDHSVFDGAGTVQVDAPLQVQHYYGTVDLSSASVNIAAGQTLRLVSSGRNLPTYDGRVVLGGANLGASRGTLELQLSDVLELSSDLTHDPASGVTLQLSGANTVTSANGTETLTNLGTLELNGDTINAPLVNQGTLNLRNATLGGSAAQPSTVDNQGTLVAASDVQVDANGTYYYGSSSTINGTLTTSGSSTIQVQPGSILYLASGLVNDGVIELQRATSNYAGIEYDFGANLFVLNGDLTNAGTIVSTGTGSGTSSIHASLDNRGLLDVQQSLTLLGVQPIANTGTIDLASGATLWIVGSYTNAATIQGTGTIALPGYALTNAGTLSPGTSPGTLTVAGDLLLTPTSVLAVELLGTNPGEYDVVDVTGTATLDGTVNVLFPGAYQGALGDSFPILTASAVSGSFATVASPGGRTVTAAYGPTDATLNLQGLINRWIALSGLWSVPANWSLGVVPSAAHDVEIDVAGSVETVTIPNSSAYAINAMTLSDDLLIDTSTLNVASDFVINPGATLRLLNAQVGGAGSVANSGTIVVLPGTGSTIARIAANGGEIAVQSNAATLGQLTLANGFTNTGILRLSAAGMNTGLHVTSGTLINGGIILSEGTASGGNRLSGAIENLGALRVAETLRIDNGVTTFTQRGTADVDIAAGRLLFLNGGALDLQSAMTIDPGGSMRLSAVTVDGAAPLRNEGTLLLDSYNTVNAPLDNLGQIDVAVGSNEINGTLTQGGTVNLLASGTGGAFLNVANGFANDGTIVLDTASTGFQPRLTVTSGTLANNGLIRSQGIAGLPATEIVAQVANTGTIAVDHPLALVSNVGRVFDTAGGTLSIAAGNALSVNGGRMRIGTGTLGTSQGALRLAGTAAVLELAGDVTQPAAGWQLDLSNGLVTIDSTVPGGVTFTNAGVLELAGDRFTANVAVDNQGLLRVPGGTGATVQGSLTNTGTIQAQASAAGNAVLTANSGVSNAGTIELTADATGGIGQLALGGGALTNAATGAVRSLAPLGATQPNRIQGQVGNQGLLDATHDLTITGAVTIPSTAAGVMITGDGALAIEGAFTVNATGASVAFAGTGLLTTSAASTINGAQLHLDGRAWDNAGAMSIDGRLTLDNGAVLTNQAGATLTLGGSNGVPIFLGTGAPGSVVNAGTITKASAALQTIQPTLDNRGALEVDSGVLELAGSGTHSGIFALNAAGSELRFGAGTHTLNGPTFSGSGLVRVNGATLDAGAATTIPNPFALQSGTLTGAGDLTLNGALALSGGTISGTGTLVTNANTTETNGTALVDARTWRNFGDLAINGRINLDNGATLVNEAGASIDLAAGSTNIRPLLWDGTGLQPTLSNLGTLTKSATLDQQISVAVDNGGTLDIAAGQLELMGGGTHSGRFDLTAGSTLRFTGGSSILAAGTDVTGAGRLAMGSGATLTVDTPLTIANASLEGGTLTGSADVTVSGTLAASNVTITRSGGSPVLRTQGVAAIGGTTTLTDRRWDNSGTLTIGGGGVAAQILLSGVAVLENRPAGTVTIDPTLGVGTPVGGAGSFVNAGVLNMNATTDKTIPSGVAFGNSGVLNANSATLRVDNFAAGTNDGAIAIAAGAALSTNGKPLANSGSGWIGGTGTLDLGGNTLTNAGTLSPGASPGTLRVNGALALMPTSLLAVEIAGRAAGQFDVLAVSGNATLDGTLGVTLPGAYRGAVGDAFAVLTAAGVSGAFAAIQAPAGMGFGARYGAPGVTLSIDSLLNRWAATSGLWTLDSNWALARAPVAGDDVVLDLGAGQAVVVPAGTPLDVASVSVSGGTLALQGAAAIATGTQLHLSGGAVTSAGSLDSSGTVTVSGGTLQVNDLINRGTLDLSGGGVAAAGVFSNAGSVRVANTTLTLGGGDGGIGGGSYDVGSGGRLQLTGGGYDIAALNTASGGSLLIDGASVTAGPLANAGTTTLQSGSLRVDAVTNSGTLNLNGGSFARTALAAFGNSGAVNVSAGSLSLDGGDGGVGGGAYNVAPGAALRFTGGSYGISAIGGAGSVAIEGVGSPVKLHWSGTLAVAAQTLTITGGAHSAEIDPPDLTLNIPGGLSLTGGSATDAYALIAGDNVTITTSALSLTGGAGDGSFAGIQALAGNTKITVTGPVTMSPGTGAYASAGITATAAVQVAAVSCEGCPTLADDPFLSATPTAGLFGSPVTLVLPASVVAVPSSVIVGAQEAQTGAEVGAGPDEEQEEEAEEKQAADEASPEEEQKSEKQLQLCM
jgi:hypothetical protein